MSIAPHMARRLSPFTRASGRRAVDAMAVVADGIEDSMIFAALIMHLLRKIHRRWRSQICNGNASGPLNRPTALGAVNCKRGSSSWPAPQVK
jgi:hypothetical protein